MSNDTEDRGDDVRVLLETAQVPPARADLARAVASGATVQRRRRYAAVAAVTVFALVGTAALSQALTATRGNRMDAPAGGPVTATPDPLADCAVRVLVPPGGKAALAGRVVADPTGRYVAGGVVVAGGRTQPVLWTDGQAQVLRVGAGWAEPHAVNAAGVAVGTANTEDGGQSAWVYAGGRVTALAKVPKHDGWIPHAINENGDVAGEAWRGERSSAVVWPAGRPGEVRVLPGPESALAFGIADDGTVVGTVGDGGAPYAWGPDGTGRRLALPEEATNGQAMAVRGQWAVGWVSASVPDGSGTPPMDPGKAVQLPDEKQRRMSGVWAPSLMPARWNLATGEVVVWTERTEPASAVNASGWVVLPSAPGAGPAMVARDGALVALPGSATGYPTSVSDDGRRLYGQRTGAQTDKAGLANPDGTPDELLAWEC